MVVSPTNQDSGLKSRDQSTVCYRLVPVDETYFDMMISVGAVSSLIVICVPWYFSLM